MNSKTANTRNRRRITVDRYRDTKKKSPTIEAIPHTSCIKGSHVTSHYTNDADSYVTRNMPIYSRAIVDSLEEMSRPSRVVSMSPFYLLIISFLQFDSSTTIKSILGFVFIFLFNFFIVFIAIFINIIKYMLSIFSFSFSSY